MSGGQEFSEIPDRLDLLIVDSNQTIASSLARSAQDLGLKVYYITRGDLVVKSLGRRAQADLPGAYLVDTSVAPYGHLEEIFRFVQEQGAVFRYMALEHGGTPEEVDGVEVLFKGPELDESGPYGFIQQLAEQK